MTTQNKAHVDTHFFKEFVYLDKKLGVSIFNGSPRFSLSEIESLFDIPSEIIAGDEEYFKLLPEDEEMLTNVWDNDQLVSTENLIDKETMYAIMFELNVEWEIKRWIIEFVVPYLDKTFSSLALYSQIELEGDNSAKDRDKVEVALINFEGEKLRQSSERMQKYRESIE